MPRGEPATELSDFEKQRAANIAERDALLKKLTLEAQSTGLFKKPPAFKSGVQSAKKKAPAKRVKKENEAPAPRRTSLRLAGITAESEVAKRKAEVDYQAEKAVQQAKRVRVSGDLDLGNIIVSGQKWDSSGLLGIDATSSPPAKYGRTFTAEDIKNTTDKDLKAMREKMSGLQLWGSWEPNRIKITPERIYSMSFHPTETKPLIFAGDKLGNLGILDASQSPPKSVKVEDDDEDAEEDDPDPVITTIKPHSRTISAMHIHPATPSKLYMASYDSSIRALDLEKSVATEAYAPASTSDDEPLSGVDTALENPHVLYFTTLDGYFGRHDTRMAGDADSSKNATDLYQLSEKKIGGFSLCPSQPHYFATASLDRFMRLWDLRHLSKRDPSPIGEHESSLSVSHAAFNAAGQIATSSYDNTIKIYDFGAKGLDSWKKGHTLDESDMQPTTKIRHNCQTGRWVTILRPQWQASPQSPIQRFCIGNMNRFIDIYTSSGQQLAQLSGDGLITAVPAVSVFHRTQDWVVGGTASGKVCLWM
ncbi:WD repeat-containing protein [Polytolypa hystricis UAMH7299]|uniref:DNA damage-binding protein CMR1 n=1 Tax=Polytolypa hystricis (strain UAMH7299) TaxID=1447883 RepID=A0A2B7YRC4_POLH7|nr:WD repeat-containing protein [Polytolypa hystricis UAMH7299]